HKMIILGTEELKQAESVLKQSFPESIKVYGCIFNINRGKPHNLEVIADQWPDFTVIMYNFTVHYFNIYSIYSTSKDSLKNFLNTPGVINKDAFTLLLTFSFIFDVFSSAGLRFVPLSAAHAHLVNSTWKYGGDRNSYNSVLNYISHNPSLCVIEEGGTEPISWLLVYQHAALGLLYTLPQHRQKGYAKALVSMMAKNLLERGHPVYCFVEEENDSSYKLFTSLLFQSSPDYRAVWFELNKRQYMQI
uniref:Glycine N-acyltransferase-like protein n=1 Tax=Sinocyclocheilus grahami TaxID=75366 RepID=A0A672SXM5_SINGR